MGLILTSTSFLPIRSGKAVDFVKTASNFHRFQNKIKIRTASKSGICGRTGKSISYKMK